MGAWSHDPFGNDDAADWLCELEESDDLSAVDAALGAVTDQAEEYLEAPQCSCALAAAEIVAAMLGRPIASLPDEASNWIAGKTPPSDQIVAKARQGVTNVLQSSELRELWEESEDYARWQAVTRDLLSRLG